MSAHADELRRRIRKLGLDDARVPAAEVEGLAALDAGAPLTAAELLLHVGRVYLREPEPRPLPDLEHLP